VLSLQSSQRLEDVALYILTELEHNGALTESKGSLTPVCIDNGKYRAMLDVGNQDYHPTTPRLGEKYFEISCPCQQTTLLSEINDTRSNVFIIKPVARLGNALERVIADIHAMGQQDYVFKNLQSSVRY